MRIDFKGILIKVVAAAGLMMAFGARSYAAEVAADSDLPSYIMIIDDEANVKEIAIPDSVFNAIAGSTIFRVNRMELNLKDPWLNELTDYTLPLVNDRKLMLMGMDLRGAASPEGPYRWNVTLSRGRAKALTNFLAQHIDSISSLEMITNTIAEDYPRLLWIMEQRGDPDTEVVRDIMSRYGVDNHAAIKEALKAYKGGSLWRRLLKQIFPELRSARVVLIFKKINPAEKEPVPVEEFERRIYEKLVGTMPVAAPIATPSSAAFFAPFVLERPHLLSISSNLLYDAFWMPNFGWAPMPNLALEYYPLRGKFTYRAAFMWPYYHKWDKQKFFQIRDYHLEVRRYFNPGELHTGAYLGAYINATKYGIGLGKKKGWQGEGMGGAIKAGYVLPLGNGRWRLDFHIAAGAWMTRFDPYVYGNPINGDEDGDYYYDWTLGPDTFHKRNHRLWWFGPSEIGITLTYDLLYKRLRRSGVSFKRKEVVVK